MTDKTLVCKDCNAEFIFTEGEQKFYIEKGFQNEPQRCLSCRAINKQQRGRRSNFSRNKGFGNSYGNKVRIF